MDYGDFINKKFARHQASGFECDSVNEMLFPFQRDIVLWALRQGRACIFADCGLGKTPMQLEWAYQVCRHENGSALILAPLAVARQTQKEGVKFGISVNICESQADVKPGINITNYEKLHKFNPDHFCAVALDESSILKNYSGKMRNQIIESFANTPYKLACTATPAPNDYMELGNHAEFCGIMTRSEMLSMFFVHDGGETSKWRLKGHARNEYWKWLCSFAVMMRRPSDLGYDDDGFILPPLNIHNHIVSAGAVNGSDALFRMPAITLNERRIERRDSINARCEKAAEIANSYDEPVLIWCDLNDESKLLSSLIYDCKEITGSMSDEEKAGVMIGFSNGDHRAIVTKPSIAGFGMNWQHCSKEIFVGLSDSYEAYYQAMRRCYRFGQTKPVDVHIVYSDMEGAVIENIQRKDRDAEEMAASMVKHMSVYNSDNIHRKQKQDRSYKPQERMALPEWMTA